MASPQCDLPLNTRCTTYLTCGQKIGLVVTAEAGLISVIAVLILFYTIIRNVMRQARKASKKEWQFFKSPLDVYMLSLFISDLLQGFGYAFNIKWVARGNVKCGSYCTAQGALQQLGETTVALATLCIAAHTFIIILFRKGSEAILIASLLVGMIWLYVILFIAVGLGTHNKAADPFETPTPYWCWIGDRFTGERIAGEYFWFWFTGLASVVLYVLVFCCLRGNIHTEELHWWRIQIRKRPTTNNRGPLGDDNSPQESKEAAKNALNMLLYPVCYVGLILPLSVVRWIDFVLDGRHPTDPNNIQQNIPSAATFTVISIFCLSGLVNVTLILRTKRGLLMLSDPEPSPRPAPGPIFESSENIVANGREPDMLRLRPQAQPVLNI